MLLGALQMNRFFLQQAFPHVSVVLDMCQAKASDRPGDLQKAHHVRDLAGRILRHAALSEEGACGGRQLCELFRTVVLFRSANLYIVLSVHITNPDKRYLL